jgi:hypothetical protein
MAYTTTTQCADGKPVVLMQMPWGISKSAASRFVTSNSVAMAGASGASADGSPTFDASLAEALQEGAKTIGENLKR